LFELEIATPYVANKDEKSSVVNPGKGGPDQHKDVNDRIGRVYSYSSQGGIS